MNRRSAAYARIWAVVQAIPQGRVATYGQVAAAAGFPRAARLAGQALAHSPGEPALPWHRVLNARGRLSFPAASEPAQEQRRRLEAEGVRFENDRVDLARYGWRRSSELPLLD